MGLLTQFVTKSNNSQQIYVLLHKQTSKYHSVVNIFMIMNLIAMSIQALSTREIPKPSSKQTESIFGQRYKPLMQGGKPLHKTKLGSVVYSPSAYFVVLLSLESFLISLFLAKVYQKKFSYFG